MGFGMGFENRIVDRYLGGFQDTHGAMLREYKGPRHFELPMIAYP